MKWLEHPKEGLINLDHVQYVQRDPVSGAVYAYNDKYYAAGVKLLPKDTPEDVAKAYIIQLCVFIEDKKGRVVSHTALLMRVLRFFTRLLIRSKTLQELIVEHRKKTKGESYENRETESGEFQENQGGGNHPKR